MNWVCSVWETFSASIIHGDVGHTLRKVWNLFRTNITDGSGMFLRLQLPWKFWIILLSSSIFVTTLNLADTQNSTDLTDQAHLIQFSVRTFLTLWHILIVTVFCIRIYRVGRRLNSFELSCILFGIILVVRNCLLKQVIEGKIKGEMEVVRRRGRRRKKLLDDLKDRRGYSHLKEDALDRTMWRHRFGGGFGPVVRQNTEWMNVLVYL